jgi:hypothetical protein
MLPNTSLGGDGLTAGIGVAAWIDSFAIEPCVNSFEKDDHHFKVCLK